MNFFAPSNWDPSTLSSMGNDLNNLFNFNEIAPETFKEDEEGLITIADIKAAKLNFETIVFAFKAAHRNIQKIQKKITEYEMEISKLDALTKNISKKGIFAQLNEEFMLETNMKSTDYAALFDIFNKSTTSLLENMQIRRTKLESSIISEKSRLNETKEVISEIENIIKFVQKDVDIAALNVAPAAITSLECSICKVAQVTHALKTCGHTFCGECIEYMNRKCAYCNALTYPGDRQAKALRLYFT